MRFLHARMGKESLQGWDDMSAFGFPRRRSRAAFEGVAVEGVAVEGVAVEGVAVEGGADSV